MTNDTTYADLAADDDVTDITLEAQWTEKSYTIQYDNAEGCTDTMIKWTETITLPTPNARAGYTFDHWEYGSTQVETNTAVSSLIPNDDVGTTLTLRAVWIAKVYTVAYEVDGGDEISSKTVEWADAGLLPSSTPSKADYTFNGWKYGSIDVTNETAYCDLVVEDNVAGITLVAQWTPSENVDNPVPSDPSIMVDPPVKKSVTGTPGTPGTFTFKLEAEDKSNPMPSGSEDGVKLMTIIGQGEEDFGTWSYTEAGTYHYTVSEIDNGEDGYTYDTTVYTITDQVLDVNGQLMVERTVSDSDASDKPVDCFEFINQYTSDAGTAEEPDGNGTDEGTGKGTGSGSGSGTASGSGTGNGTSSKTADDTAIGAVSGIVKSTSSNTTSSNTTSSTKVVKTGDEAITEFYQYILFISGAALIICAMYLITNRKKRGVNT